MSGHASRSLLVVSQLPPPVHGSSVMTKHLMAALSASPWDTHIVERNLSKNIDEVNKVTIAKPLRVLTFIIRLSGWVFKKRPEACIYFLSSSPTGLAADTLALAVLRVLRVPLVSYIHTSGLQERRNSHLVWRHLIDFCLSSSDCIVALSPKLAAELPASASPRKTKVIANASHPLTPPDPEMNETDEHVGKLVFLSNFISSKGVDDFIALSKAFEGSSWEFVLCGTPVSEDQERLLLQTFTGPRRRLILRPTPQQRSEEFATSTFLIFPSVYPLEAQPLTIIEAMSVGLPTIAYDTGGISDLLTPISPNLLVPRGDFDTLCSRVQSLMSQSPAMLSGLREATRERFETAHSLDNYREHWLHVLDTFHDERAGAQQ